MVEWLTSLYSFEVEHREIPRGGGKPYYPSSRPPRGILHTTENDDIDLAWRWLLESRSAPTFITGENRIIQCRPLGVQAAALRTNPPRLPNRDVWIQIEQVGRSQQQLYSLPGGTTRPTAAILAHFADAIPLQAPFRFPDSIDDVKPFPATDNTRRKRMATIWPNWKGWAHHMEVPWQAPSWHWDSGALRRSDLFALARQLREGGEDMTPEQAKQLEKVFNFVNGVSSFEQTDAATAGKHLAADASKGAAAIDVAALAKAIAAALPPGQAPDVDAIATAVWAKLKERL